MDLSLGVLLLAGVAVLAGAAVQGSIGLGLGLVGAPALALLDPTLVPATILLVTSVLPVLTSLRELQDVDWRGLGFALTGRLPGVLIGSWVVVTQPARTTAIVRDLARAAALLPFVLAGFLLSGPLRGRVDGGTLRTCVLGLSATGAVVLLSRTLLVGA